jgi:hypothetical protein
MLASGKRLMSDTTDRIMAEYLEKLKICRVVMRGFCKEVWQGQYY